MCSNSCSKLPSIKTNLQTVTECISSIATEISDPTEIFKRLQIKLKMEYLKNNALDTLRFTGFKYADSFEKVFFSPENFLHFVTVEFLTAANPEITHEQALEFINQGTSNYKSVVFAIERNCVPLADPAFSDLSKNYVVYEILLMTYSDDGEHVGITLSKEEPHYSYSEETGAVNTIHTKVEHFLVNAATPRHK